MNAAETICRMIAGVGADPGETNRDKFFLVSHLKIGDIRPAIEAVIAKEKAAELAELSDLRAFVHEVVAGRSTSGALAAKARRLLAEEGSG